MTTDQLHTAGPALFGGHWQTDLAHALGVSDRTVRRWAAGNPIPASVAAEIADLMRARAVALSRLADTLTAA